LGKGDGGIVVRARKELSRLRYFDKRTAVKGQPLSPGWSGDLLEDSRRGGSINAWSVLLWLKNP
jgi:hypothetical protein